MRSRPRCYALLQIRGKEYVYVKIDSEIRYDFSSLFVSV